MGHGDVRVKVTAAGICAGDMHIYRGNNPYVQYPCIAGHEIAGEVLELGEGVTGFAIGDRVVVEPFLPCGNCYPCRIGKGNCCVNLQIIGVHRPGGYAENLVAPAHRLHPIPATLSIVRASFAEPLAIAVQACRRAELGKEVCLIQGCGPIGLALIEVARSRGATVYATDIDRSRIEMAESLGANVRLADDNLGDWSLRVTESEGFPVVFEATGVVPVISQSLDLVASGGRVVVVGLVPRGVQVPFAGLDLTRKEATILGSRASVGCFPEAISLLDSDKITYPDVATQLSMWDAPKIFDQLDPHPESMHKGVLVP